MPHHLGDRTVAESGFAHVVQVALVHPAAGRDHLAGESKQRPSVLGSTAVPRRLSRIWSASTRAFSRSPCERRGNTHTDWPRRSPAPIAAGPSRKAPPAQRAAQVQSSRRGRREFAMARIMFGTMPSLECTASSRSLALPVADSGEIALRRDMGNSISFVVTSVFRLIPTDQCGGYCRIRNHFSCHAASIRLSD